MTQLVFLLALVSSLGLAKEKQFLPQLLQEVEKKYAEAKTLTAQFDQENEVVALNQKKKSSGKILVKRPNKFRWETEKPDKSLMVSNGSKVWFYTPPFDEDERGQVIEKKSAQIESKLAQALLSGAFGVAKDMRIQVDGATRFTLIPKKGTGGPVNTATIEVDGIHRLIKTVTLRHKGGNKTVIELKKIELGKDMNDDLFVFTPPPNTDKVTQ